MNKQEIKQRILALKAAIKSTREWDSDFGCRSEWFCTNKTFPFDSQDLIPTTMDITKG